MEFLETMLQASSYKFRDLDIDAGLLLGVAPRSAEILHPASHCRHHQQGNESCTANIFTDLNRFQSSFRVTR